MASAAGLTPFRSIDLDETEEDVKTLPGKLYGWVIHNAHGSAKRYIKFYNATAANVMVGTTTPVMTWPISSGETLNEMSAEGIDFDTAICVAATTGLADNDTGAPGANEIICNLFYK